MNVYLGSLVLPLAPEELRREADGQTYTYEAINPGEFVIARGRKPQKFAWSGLLPGDLRSDLPVAEGSLSAAETAAHIALWMADNTILGLVVTGTDINLDVTVTRFERSHKGGLGDIHYDLELTEHRELLVLTTDAPADLIQPWGSETPQTYTVTDGDEHLWTVARRLWGDGSRWPELLEANHELLGGDPGAVRPGMTLRVPGFTVRRYVRPGGGGGGGGGAGAPKPGGIDESGVY